MLCFRLQVKVRVLHFVGVNHWPFVPSALRNICYTLSLQSVTANACMPVRVSECMSRSKGGLNLC